jgi:NAD(P)-dependent dehydrogenase (short-subunit alcohol dehydrogenase family)
MTQRVALVTGAMGGLGTAICQELAKAGHKVVASYHPQFDNKDAWLKPRWLQQASMISSVLLATCLPWKIAKRWLPKPKLLAARSTS